MTSHQLSTLSALLLALVAQALLPRMRLLIVTSAALVSLVCGALFGAVPASSAFSQVPWDVLVIVVVLGLFSEFLAGSRVFGVLALRAAELSKARPGRLTVVFVVAMYAVSGVVNNLTALLLVLPVLLNLLKLVGTTQRALSWTLSALLIACNLGGAATPVGDFPAILLLGRGAMSFSDYLVRALPQTALALALFLVATRLARPERDVPVSPLTARLALTTMRALFRNVTVDRRTLWPSVVALGGMVLGWTLLPPSLGLGPEVVAWAGAALVLASHPSVGEALLRRKVDVEAVLFLLALFVLVGAVRAAGTFELAGAALSSLPVSPKAQVMVFLVAAAVLTGLFSAGPGMAALLDVAESLARQHPPAAIYVGLAMSVCAGSSLFLTAATAGPLTQSLTERVGLRVEGGAVARFGFFEFLPVGVLGFSIILATGLAFVWSAL